MKSNYLDNIVFLIPSLDPDEKMPQYVKSLIKEGAKHILVVDDGSSNENQKYFKQIAKLKEVIILRHAVNQGKGRGLKTGFNYILDNMPKIKGVITADADGQHAPDDTVECARVLAETNDVVFGTRNFNEEIVPFKSRNGNKITTAVFALLYGKVVHDTQTGLRGLPIEYLTRCMKLEGERFEYEIAMLIDVVQTKRNIVEVPIKTIYFDSNRATHFDTFKDSFRIYRIMMGTFLKFAISSLLSSVVDLALFSLWMLILSKANYKVAIFFATLFARVISTLCNYAINKNVIFKSKDKTKASMIRYYILAVIQMLASWLFVTFVFSKIQGNATIIKLFVDVVLFMISYQVQRKWVFKEDK